MRIIPFFFFPRKGDIEKIFYKIFTPVFTLAGDVRISPRPARIMV